jgi:hypothetical protein
LLDKTNTFHCTQSIEEGCLALRERAEFRTDKDIYHVIRLQRIIEKIDSLANPAYSDPEAQTAYLRTLAELEGFRDQLVAEGTDSRELFMPPPKGLLLISSDFLFMQFHTAKLFLYQVAYFERSLQQSPSLHLSMLCEGLESAKAFMDLYLWLPPQSEQNLTNSEWMQLSFGLTLAAKFAVVSKDPSVEPQTRERRRQLNIDNVFRHLILRIGALVGRDADGTRRKDIFAHYENRVRRIQTWYERMCRATGSDSPTVQSNLQQQLPPPIPSQNQTQAQMIPQQQATYPFHPAYTQQPTMTYAATNSSTTSTTDLASVGMTTLSPSQYVASTGYAPVPSIAFPDLMTAPGWDNLFDIPMMDSEWVWANPTQPLPQTGLATSPTSDGTWRSSPASGMG